PQSQSPVSEKKEAEKIRSLFENIRQANLKKNIGLFMSCYSHDFEDKEGKRLAVLETWENFNYLDLSYRLKKQTITGDTADVRVEWLIRTSPKAGGHPQDSRTVLNVTLSREEGNWKIKTIKSAG
ncbi:MAG TPA: nuclear transport factor 2 family protein, partial [Thermodesulfobacteriota bacterium]|nr:nuclear transport factor 2 family protein [Thermodesulfobacteriota bacterium]